MRARKKRAVGKSHDVIYEYCLRRYRVVWSLNEWQQREDFKSKKKPKSVRATSQAERSAAAARA